MPFSLLEKTSFWDLFDLGVYDLCGGEATWFARILFDLPVIGR